MMVRNAAALGEIPSGAALRSILEEFHEKSLRLERLKAMYDGRQDVLLRTRSRGLPNNRLAHGFARYITTMAAGYLVGNPVEYDAPDPSKLGRLLEMYRLCNVDGVDTELARQASIYGKGVELMYTLPNQGIRCAAVDPRKSFVVYDDTVANEALLGVRITQRTDERGVVCEKLADVYTARWSLTYRLGGELPALCRQEPHFFGEVPMVEYWNGEDERGDFEGVITLIDAYDRLQSDRLNDKEQYVDALLVLTGCTLETDDLGRTPGEQLRQDRVLLLPDSDAHAEWLGKQLNETDTEVLKRAIAADIHKLSMVPDLSDVRFSGYESGVAMRYKLLGLEQLTRIKERNFREGLRRRMRIFNRVLGICEDCAVDIGDVKMIFNRAIPIDDLEQAKALAALKGILPEEELEKRARRGGV